jgi:Ca2+-binding EF-hand superfamily protein
MHRRFITERVRLAAITTLMATAGVFAQGPPAGGQGAPAPVMQASPVLNVIDVNHDGSISADELGRAPERLKTLDKNGDGKLTRDEAGAPAPARGRGPGGPGERGGPGGRGEEAAEPPIPGPTADELLATLLGYDKNKDGKLDKTEVPQRQQGMFDRGDADKNGIMDAAELRKLAADQAAAPPAPPMRRGGGPGGGRGGFGPFDPAAGALDTDRNGEISAEEIGSAATSLKSLDKNGDGTISEDEVRPVIGEGRGETL